MDNFLQIFNQLKFVIKQGKLIILLCVFGVLAPVIYYNEVAPRIYEASVSIIFEDISSPLNNDKYSQLRTYQRETYILNNIQEIESRAVAEEIAVGLSPDLIRRFPFPEELPPAFDEIEFLTNKIKRGLSTSVIRRTDVVRVKFSTEDPFLSMSLANIIAEVLRKRNLKLKKMEASGLVEFIEEQKVIFQDQLNESEQKLKQFKKSNKITSLQRESEEILRRITDAEVRYNETKTQRRATAGRLQTIKEKLSLNREKLVLSATDVSSPAYTQLKQTLVDLQVQYTGLIVREYSDNHPKLVELRRRIEQVKENLTREALRVVNDESGVDPLSQINAYLTQSVKLEVDLETYKAQELALRQILNEYEAKLKTLPEQELELAGLMRSKNVTEKLFMMLAEKREEARISGAERIGNLRVIDFAKLPGQPVRPKKAANLSIGAVIGLLLGFGLVFTRHFLNKTIKRSEEIEALTSWEVLAVVPKIEISSNGGTESNNSQNRGPMGADAKRGMLTSHEPTGVAAEAFRVLRTNMQFLSSKHQMKTVLVTSLMAGDGKSTTATNLGITLTKLGMKVLLIDADLRRPTAHKLLRVAKEPGLADVLLNHHTIVSDLIAEDLEKEFYDNASESPVWSNIQSLKAHKKNVELLEENFIEFSQATDGNKNDKLPKLQYRNLLNTSLIESVQSTRVKGLKVLSCGKLIENPSEILSSASLKLLLEEVGKKFDWVLIDSPPLLVVPDSMIMSSLVDGVMVVLEFNKCEPQMLLNAHKFLTKTGANVIGAVLNKVDLGLMYKDKDYYYYG